MRTASFLTVAALFLAGCSPLPRAGIDAPNPVERTCADRNLAGSTPPAFCVCMGREAAYATQGDRLQMERLAWLMAQSTPTLDHAWARIKPTHTTSPMGVVQRDWRVMLHNTTARCAAHSTNDAPFFGLAY